MDLVIDDKTPVSALDYVHVGEVGFLGRAVGKDLISAYRDGLYLFLFAGVLSDHVLRDVRLGCKLGYPLVDGHDVWAKNQGPGLQAAHDSQSHDGFSASAGHDYGSESCAGTHVSQKGTQCLVLVVSELDLQIHGDVLGFYKRNLVVDGVASSDELEFCRASVVFGDFEYVRVHRGTDEVLEFAVGLDGLCNEGVVDLERVVVLVVGQEDQLAVP